MSSVRARWLGAMETPSYQVVSSIAMARLRWGERNLVPNCNFFEQSPGEGSPHLNHYSKCHKDELLQESGRARGEVLAP